MAELPFGEEKIVTLATAFRMNFTEEKTYPERKRYSTKFVNELKSRADSVEQFKLPDTLLNFPRNESFFERDDDGDDSSELETSLWNKAFNQLKPPQNSSKRKSTRIGEKFLDKSCEEILEYMRPFKSCLKVVNEDDREISNSVPNFSKNQIPYGKDEDDRAGNFQPSYEFFETPVPIHFQRNDV